MIRFCLWSVFVYGLFIVYGPFQVSRDSDVLANTEERCSVARTPLSHGTVAHRKLCIITNLYYSLTFPEKKQGEPMKTGKMKAWKKHEHGEPMKNGENENKKRKTAKAASLL